MKHIRGTPYLSAWRHTVSDCGSTPATPSNTATAPSSTRSERSTSIGEVDVAGRVDDVDAVLEALALVGLPEAGRRSRRDRDPALLLLLHPVHRGGAVMDFADLVGLAGVIEDALGRRRLAGVDVRHDADIAIALERMAAGHDSSLGCRVGARRACELPDIVTAVTRLRPGSKYLTSGSG